MPKEKKEKPKCSAGKKEVRGNSELSKGTKRCTPCDRKFSEFKSHFGVEYEVKWEREWIKNVWFLCLNSSPYDSFKLEFSSLNGRKKETESFKTSLDYPSLNTSLYFFNHAQKGKERTILQGGSVHRGRLEWRRASFFSFLPYFSSTEFLFLFMERLQGTLGYLYNSLFLSRRVLVSPEFFSSLYLFWTNRTESFLRRWNHRPRRRSLDFRIPFYSFPLLVP